jgi:hypothetical protein
VRPWARVCGGLAAGIASLAMLAGLVTPFAVLPGLAAAALAAVTLIGLADWQVLRRPPIRGYLEA